MAISDCWSDVLRTRWANLVLFLDFRRGHWNDLSSFAQATAAAGTPVWKRSQYGQCLDFLTRGGSVVVTDAASLRCQAGCTLISFGWEPLPQGKAAAARIISKRDLGGQAYDWDYQAGTWLAIDGLSLSTVAGCGRRMNGFTTVQGAIPRFYTDGSFLAPGNLVCTIPNDDANVYIGSLVNVAGWDTAWHHTDLIFDTALTDTEVSQLYEDWMRSDWVG